MDGDKPSVEIGPDEALARLQRPDGIMEFDVIPSLESYLRHGGADTAIDALAQNYCGSAQVCNIMCDWLTELGDEPAATPPQKEKAKPTVKKGRGRPSKDKKKEGDPSKSPPKSPLKAVDEPKEPVDGRKDAVTCVEETLANLITRNFCPDAADRIFEDGGIGIDWVPELIAHRRWRKFLYELMEQYPQCLMLNFAVKLISDAGFQNEISSVNTAAQQLDIFSRVFLTSMDSVLREHAKGCRTAAYEKALGEMVRVVCQNEHTYVYAAALLKKMCSTMKGRAASACRHVAEELRAALDGKECESTVTRLALMQTRHDQIPHSVTQALLTMMSKNELNPADISVVYDQFIMPRPPPIDVIRDAILIEMLIDSLFHSEGPKVSHEHRDKYIFLLAYAASVAENVNKNGQRTQARLELDPCRHALERAVALLEATDDLLADLGEILHAARSSVVACGILYYVKTLLLSEARLGDLPGAALVILDHVATTHSHLHESVFEICCQLYDKISGDPEAAEVIMERQRLVVDRLVHLLSQGAVIPVLEKVSHMFRDGYIDASLVRYFATEGVMVLSTRELLHIRSLLEEAQNIFGDLLVLTLHSRSYVRPEHEPYLETRFRTFDSYLSSLSSGAFIEYSRLSVEEFEDLATRLGPLLEHSGTHRSPITIRERIGIFLRWCGHGSSYAALSHEFNVGKTTVSQVVIEVAKAINQELYADAFPLPRATDFEDSAQKFQDRYDYPRAVACIDGKHVAIKCPPASGSTYYNYKNFFSVVLLALANADYRILMFDLGSPGRNSDSGVFNTSQIKRFLALNDHLFPATRDLNGQGDVDFHILADGGFGMTKRFVRPFTTNQCSNSRKRRYFNGKLSSSRRIVESVFGILCRRWRVFMVAMQLAPDRVCEVVLAMLILHNVMALRTDALAFSQRFRPVTNALVNAAPGPGGNSATTAKRNRDRLVEYFAVKDNVV